jgi:hypothetical protein
MDRVTESGLDFKDFEQWCYDMGMAFARMLMMTALTNLDYHILKTRDKSLYRTKGFRQLTLKTLMGEVDINRRLYRTVGEDGAVMHIHLLDRMIGLDTIGKISMGLIMRMAEVITESSYRATASAISFMSGQTISHTGVWNAVQAVGVKIRDVDGRMAKAAKAFMSKGKKAVGVLQEEFDGVWINMQGKDRPAKGRKSEMKVASAYEGVRFTGMDKEGRPTYDLVNPVYIAGFEKADEFFGLKEGLLGSIYDLDEIQTRLINGDGGGWVQGFSSRVDAETHLQLDPFHIKRAIKRSGLCGKAQGTIAKALSMKKIGPVLRYIRLLLHKEGDAKKKDNIGKLYGYFSENAEYLIPVKERGLVLPDPEDDVIYGNMGTMEGTVCSVIALRMKKRRASFTRDGANNLARLLCAKRSGRLDDTISSLSAMSLPMPFEQMVTDVLSAAQAPKVDGKGFHYPVNGAMPFYGAYTTSGRRAVQYAAGYHRSPDGF